MVRSREAAVAAAMKQTRNTPGTCQATTRDWYLAPAVGDVDRDKDADAVDGWKSEPASARHEGDRNPPIGVPVAFSGGGSGYGHRAIVRGPNGALRSTDMSEGRYAKGVTGNATIEDCERSMGVSYLGWSETISGIPIPKSEEKPVVVPLPVHGADISHHQSSVNLAKAKQAGLLWIWLKCTQGDRFVDPTYRSRRDAARLLGLPPGPYHFAETTPPKPQVEHLVKNAGYLPGDFRWMLDVEDDKSNNSYFSKMSIGQRTDHVGNFVALGTAELGLKPYIYIPASLPLEETFGCKNVSMRYNNLNEEPEVAAPWERYSVRQFTNGVYGMPKSFPGLGHVDLNSFHKSLDPADAVRRNRLTADPKPTRGKRVDEAIAELKAAKGRGQRGELIDEALKALESIKLL